MEEKEKKPFAPSHRALWDHFFQTVHILRENPTELGKFLDGFGPLKKQYQFLDIPFLQAIKLQKTLLEKITDAQAAYEDFLHKTSQAPFSATKKAASLLPKKEAAKKSLIDWLSLSLDAQEKWHPQGKISEHSFQALLLSIQPNLPQINVLIGKNPSEKALQELRGEIKRELREIYKEKIVKPPAPISQEVTTLQPDVLDEAVFENARATDDTLLPASHGFPAETEQTESTKKKINVFKKIKMLLPSANANPHVPKGKTALLSSNVIEVIHQIEKAANGESKNALRNCLSGISVGSTGNLAHPEVRFIIYRAQPFLQANPAKRTEKLSAFLDDVSNFLSGKEKIWKDFQKFQDFNDWKIQQALEALSVQKARRNRQDPATQGTRKKKKPMEWVKESEIVKAPRDEEEQGNGKPYLPENQADTLIHTTHHTMPKEQRRRR